MVYGQRFAGKYAPVHNYVQNPRAMQKRVASFVISPLEVMLHTLSIYAIDLGFLAWLDKFTFLLQRVKPVRSLRKNIIDAIVFVIKLRV